MIIYLHLSQYLIVCAPKKATEEPPKKKKKKKSGKSKKQTKVIKPDATSKAASKSNVPEVSDLSEAILASTIGKNTMKVGSLPFFKKLIQQQ
jgi:hypothetical protein